MTCLAQTGSRDRKFAIVERKPFRSDEKGRVRSGRQFRHAKQKIDSQIGIVCRACPGSGVQRSQSYVRLRFCERGCVQDRRSPQDFGIPGGEYIIIITVPVICHYRKVPQAMFTETKNFHEIFSYFLRKFFQQKKIQLNIYEWNDGSKPNLCILFPRNLL